jgi:hypothetical protein
LAGRSVGQSLTAECLIKRLVGQEAVEKSQGCGGLVHRHHVAGLVHLQEGQAAFAGAGLGSARHAASNRGVGRGGVGGVVPGVVGLGVVAVVAGPAELLGPGLVSDPVADEIHVTSVDHHTNATLQHGDQHLTKYNNRKTHQQDTT